MIAIYYCVIIMSFIVYLIYAKKTQIPLYSFSNVFYFSGLILSYLPGYFVASGKIDVVVEAVSYWGFDYELMLIYLMTAVMVPFALITGSYIAGGKYIKVLPRRKFNLRYKFLLFFVASYLCYYLFWIPSIPVFELFKSGLSQAYESRLRITHGFAYLEPPFILRYWRNIIQNLMVLLFFIYFIKMYQNKKNKTFININFLLFFFLVVFCYTYNLEKAAVIQFFIACFFLVRILDLNFDYKWSDFNKVVSFKGLALLLTLAALLIIVSKYFMGGDYTYAFSRIARQDASNYLQIQYIRDSGFLGVSGLDSAWLKLLGVQPAPDVSVMAIQEMYPRALEDGAGAAGGMFATNLFFSFGWFFVPLCFLYVFILSFLDRILRNTIEKTKKKNTYLVLLSFYLIITANLALAALSSFKYVFSFTYIFSPEVIILFLYCLIFVRFKLISYH